MYNDQWVWSYNRASGRKSLFALKATTKMKLTIFEKSEENLIKNDP